MEEKYMVNDILESVKSELTTYQKAISETEDIGLRQAIQSIRDTDEAFQYELFKVAQAKQYYIPSSEASQTEIDKIKSEVNN